MTGFVSRRCAVCIAGVIGLSTCIGCSGGPKIPPTHAVSGKITYQDKPLAGAEVGFVSSGDNKDVLAARGVTNDSGEFKLSTYVDAQHTVSGATAGDYAVTVSKTETMDQEKMREQFATNPNMEFKKLVPAKYTNPKESPLKAKVEAGKSNTFEFKLED
ncbi:MAG TPA: hypothetical protein VM165_03290 [Planctomycetaceae bacterium]|nr:hypothetical protein [Planctomycetaceae bacterium]